MGSLTTTKTDYPSMLAGYGDFGALQRIAYFTSASSFANYTFSNIPQTFQDLRVVLYARDTNTTAGALGLYFGVNGDTAGTSNSITALIGNGSSATSGRSTNQSTAVVGTIPSANSTSGIFGAFTMEILNYTNTTTFKTFLSRSAADLNGSGETRLTVSLWRSTNAITSMIFGANTAFAAGTTIALYGVRASAA
jgi:hypothetical protein